MFKKFIPYVISGSIMMMIPAQGVIPPTEEGEAVKYSASSQSPLGPPTPEQTEIEETVLSSNNSVEGEISDSPTEAIRLLKLAADGGDMDAQYKLALAYSDGIGVEKDEKECFRFLKGAAYMGHKNAQYLLGEASINCVKKKKDYPERGNQ